MIGPDPRMAHRTRALPSDTPGRLAEHVPTFVAGAVTGLALVALGAGACIGRTAIEAIGRALQDRGAPVPSAMVTRGFMGPRPPRSITWGTADRAHLPFPRDDR
jgi:hypothetical protein